MDRAVLRPDGRTEAAAQDASRLRPPGAAGPQGLLVDDLRKEWAGRTVLDGVSLSLERGTSVWVGGHNGAGKTTLLRIVAGLITPDGGSVHLDGLRPSEERRAYQRHVGFLSAGDTGLYARLSVRQNLEFWAGLSFIHPPKRRTCVDRALRRFAIEDLAGRRSDRLSLGQRQRVRLAMTFLHEPQLTLLDEPTTSLDEEGVALLASAVAEHLRRGGMVIWCDPSGREQFRFDRAFVLRDGTLHAA